MLELGIPDEWPPQVLVALAAFRLGHLLENPPLVYSRERSQRIWTPGDGDDANVTDVVAIPVERFPYGIITTQTCDINEQAKYPKQPFVQVSPVFMYSEDTDRLPEVTKKHYLVPLTAAAFAAGIWVADLRLECSVEKSVLADREPIDAFATELDEIAFAERLGRRRDRAAMGNAVGLVLSAQLDKRISANKNKAKRVFASVHGLRLEVAEGVRLDPLAMRLHVILDGDPVDEASPAIVEAREWFETWWDRASEAGEGSSPKLRLLPTAYHDVSRVDLRVYERLIPWERGV